MTTALFTLAAFVFRYATALKQGTAWFDESFSMHFASMPLPEMLRFLSGDVHPPLHAVILHYWMLLFGEHILSARMLSVVIGALTVPVMMHLAGRYGKGASIVAGVVTAFSPILLFHSADARMYPLLLLLVALSTHAFLKILDGDRKAAVHWAVYSGLALLTHITAVIPFGIMCAFGWKTAKDRKGFAAKAVFSALPAAAWVGFFTLGRIGFGGNEWQLAMPSRGGSAILRFLDLFAFASGSWMRALLLPALILLVLWAILKFRKHEGASFVVEDATDLKTRFLFVSAFLPFMLFLPVHIETTKYLFVAYPAVATLVTIGASRLFGEKGVEKALIVYLLVILYPMSYLMTERRIRWDDAMAYIEAEEAEGDVIYAAWFASELSIGAHYDGASEVRSAYTYDPELTFDERLVRHAGQIRITDEAVDEMAAFVSDAPHVFLVTGDVDPSHQKIPRWYFEHGWRVAGQYESNSFSPIVLKLENPRR